MRRPLSATVQNGVAPRNVRASTTGRSSSKSSSIQKLLIFLLLGTAATMLYIGHSHHWTGRQVMPVPHKGGGASNTAAAAAAAVRQPQTLQKFTGNLDYPLWWHAPFIAQSGLGTEAISIIEALISTREMAAEDIYITHSGDTFDHDILRTLSPATRNLLARRQHPQQVADEWIKNLFPSQKQVQLQRLTDWQDRRQAIAVCHNWFDCWRRPEEFPSNMPGCPCPLAPSKTAFTVARTMFETAGLPAHLAEHVKAMDEVWVPTQFNKDSFAAAGVDPSKIRIVPEGLDTRFWDPAHYKPLNISKLDLRQATGFPAAPTALPPGTTPRTSGASNSSRPTNRPFIFLSVFKWEARKGWKDLVQAFCDAFKPTDPVVLWILAKPFMESGDDFEDKVKEFAASHYKLKADEVSKNLPRIYTSKEHLSEADFMAVYKVADVLAIPTHGEGWGRPQIEAMAMELPVITTNWSGPTAFMNEQVAYPLAIDGLSVIKSDGDRNFFKAFIGQKWAQPSLKHLIQLMQHVYNNPAEAAAKGKAARKHIQAHFTPQVVARVVAAEVRRLQPIIKKRLRQKRPAIAQSGKKGVLGKMGNAAGLHHHRRHE